MENELSRIEEIMSCASSVESLQYHVSSYVNNTMDTLPKKDGRKTMLQSRNTK